MTTMATHNTVVRCSGDYNDICSCSGDYHDICSCSDSNPPLPVEKSSSGRRMEEVEEVRFSAFVHLRLLFV